MSKNQKTAKSKFNFEAIEEIDPNKVTPDNANEMLERLAGTTGIEYLILTHEFKKWQVAFRERYNIDEFGRSCYHAYLMVYSYAMRWK